MLSINKDQLNILSASQKKRQEAEIIHWQITQKEFLLDVEICILLPVLLSTLKCFYLECV